MQPLFLRFLVVLMGWLDASVAWAEQPPVALVFGIGSYDRGPDLPNARNDAQAIHMALSKAGYRSELVLDATRDEALLALARLRITATPANQALIFFSGHGAIVNGQSYVFFRDSGLSASDAISSALPQALLVKSIADRPRQKIILLDICRDNPWQGGEVPASTPAWTQPGGVFLAHATQPGKPAYDGRNALSPFTTALLEQLLYPPTSIEDFFRAVRLRVVQLTGGLQVPTTQSTLLYPTQLRPLRTPLPKTE